MHRPGSSCHWGSIGALFVAVGVLPAWPQARIDPTRIPPEAVQALLTETTPEGRAGVLDAHPDMVSREGVFAVLAMGEKAVNEGQHDRALRACDVADEIIVRAQLDPLTRGICGLMRGGLLGKMDRHEDAINTLLAARPLVKEGKNLAIEGMLLVDLARQYEESGNVDKAKATYAEGLQLARNFGKALKLEGEILSRMGTLEGKLGRPQEAMVLLEQALDIVLRVGDKSLEASTMLKLGHLLDDMGQTARALTYHQQALELYRDESNLSGTISALNACAIDQKQLGRFRAALDLYQEALERAGAIKAESIVATVKDNMGTVLRLMGRWDEGIKLHEAALEINRRLKLPDGEQMVLNHMGIAARVMGDPRRALRFFDEALRIANSLRLPGAVATILVNEGNAHSDLGQYDEALACYRECLRIQEHLANPRAIAAALLNLAIVYGHMGRRESKKAYLLQARQQAGTARDPLTEATVLLELSGLCTQEEDPKGAAAMAEEALSLMPENSADRAMALLEVAMRHWDLGQHGKALRETEQAADLAQRTNQPRMRAVALTFAGMLRLPQERPGDAEPDPQTALKCLTDARAAGESLQDLQLTWLARYFQGKCYAALGDHARKLECYLAALETVEDQRALGWAPAERQVFAERPVRAFRLVALEYVDRGESAKAFLYAESGKAQMMLEAMSARPLTLAASRLSSQVESRHRQVLKQLGEYDALLRRARFQHEKEGKDEALVQEWLTKREQAEDELRQIKSELERQNPGFTDLRYPRPPSADQVCGGLNSNTAIIEYVVESTRVAALVLSAKGLITCRLNTSEKALRGLVRALYSRRGLRGGLFDSSQVERKGPLHQLYKTILEPVQACLPRNTRRLVLVPDGPLHFVPFAALVADPASKPEERPRYLCEDYTISYAPSVTVLRELQSRRRKQPQPSKPKDLVVAVCDPAYSVADGKAVLRRSDRGGERSTVHWPRLPATAIEGDAIRSLWGTHATLLSRGEATEKRVKEAAPTARCLHLAVHGELDSDSPLYSAIVLAPGSEGSVADGYLQAYEVCEMDLEGCVVVLSACNTARGAERDGEGLMGLTRAFFLAGASAVVATLWEVADEATSVLATELHRQLKAGMPVGEALRRAQCRMVSGRAKGQKGASAYTAPFFWAAFGVYGDANAILAR